MGIKAADAVKEKDLKACEYEQKPAGSMLALRITQEHPRAEGKHLDPEYEHRADDVNDKSYQIKRMKDEAFFKEGPALPFEEREDGEQYMRIAHTWHPEKTFPQIAASHSGKG